MENVGAHSVRPPNGKMFRLRRKPMRTRRPYRRADVGIGPYNGMLRDRLGGKLGVRAQSAVDIVGRGLAPAGGTMLRICRKVMRIRSILPPAGVTVSPTYVIETER